MQSTQPTHHGYAVNVKDQSRYDYSTALDFEKADAIYNGIAELFWMQADEAAREHGFKGVWSEGRMGGWCVPYPQPHTDDMYPEQVEAWERDVFRPFERDIIELMDDYIGEAVAALAEADRLAKAEPDEAAYWAARDVVTV